MPKRIIGLLLGLCLLLAGCSGAKIEPVTAYSFCMDTFIQQQWYGENAQATCDEIEAELASLEKLVSLYIPDSEISRINDAAGKSFVSVSDDTYAILSGSYAVCEETGGLFDITIAPLSLLWNVTGENPHVPSDADIAASQAKVDYRKLLFDDDTKSVMLSEEGMSIDLGGVVKGYAAGKMREIAEEKGVTGFLSVGGNMLVVGKKPTGGDFLIGLRDPNGGESDYFATISIPGETMATTGAYERWFEQDGVRYHHVLDPFTGYPSNKGLASVTVISTDGLLADCLSTAIFLEGTDGIDAALCRDDCSVIIVTDDNLVYVSGDISERINPVSGTKYEFIYGKQGS